jgi:hypothetical protein
LTLDNVASTVKSDNYTFIQTAGNWVNYDDFTQFNLYDPTSKSVIGSAVIILEQPKPTTTTSASTIPTETNSSYNPFSFVLLAAVTFVKFL